MWVFWCHRSTHDNRASACYCRWVTWEQNNSIQPMRQNLFSNVAKIYWWRRADVYDNPLFCPKFFTKPLPVGMSATYKDLVFGFKTSECRLPVACLACLKKFQSGNMIMFCGWTFSFWSTCFLSLTWNFSCILATILISISDIRRPHPRRRRGSRHNFFNGLKGTSAISQYSVLPKRNYRTLYNTGPFHSAYLRKCCERVRRNDILNKQKHRFTHPKKMRS